MQQRLSSKSEKKNFLTRFKNKVFFVKLKKKNIFFVFCPQKQRKLFSLFFLRVSILIFRFNSFMGKDFWNAKATETNDYDAVACRLTRVQITLLFSRFLSWRTTTKRKEEEDDEEELSKTSIVLQSPTTFPEPIRLSICCCCWPSLEKQIAAATVAQRS